MKTKSKRKARQQPSYKRLLEFAQRCAKKEYDDPDCPDPYLSSEDARAERNEMIEEAMGLLGKLSKCSDCGELVPIIVGRPDGKEVCRSCFDGGVG